MDCQRTAALKNIAETMALVMMHRKSENEYHQKFHRSTHPLQEQKSNGKVRYISATKKETKSFRLSQHTNLFLFAPLFNRVLNGDAIPLQLSFADASPSSL